MPRDIPEGPRVALLTTGDEITNGNILNTNARDIAERLTNNGIQVGTQMVIADHIHEIEQAIGYLLRTHDSLIITGGLGPTSDDLTRFALGKALDLPLVFDDGVWENIVSRLRRFGYPEPPESNRQQALFPKGAAIIHNPAGTAAGCMQAFRKQWIFMLPGPPTECLPMIDGTVLPTLKNAGFCQDIHRRNWMLFGASEGQVAEKLDTIAFSGQCMTGYRLCYPYVEFKLISQDKITFEATANKIEKEIAVWLTGNGRQMASEWFIEKLLQSGKTLAISDEATGGLLENTIKTPQTCRFLHFRPTTDSAQIIISGLDDFWLGKKVTRTPLLIRFDPALNHHDIKADIPLRDARVKLYAVEWICRQLGLLVQAE